MKVFGYLAATALSGTLLIASSAFGQSTGATPNSTTPTNTDPAQTVSPAPLGSNPQADTSSNANRGADVVVTGSRIRSPNGESASPITTISGEEIIQQGQNSLGDSLNDLPQLRSTFAQQNPGAGIGIAGLNLLDLRGLGTVRTLVLVNGRRHVAADVLNNAASVDVNTISNDLIERVDIVTGGESALYGSDAIGGVVNFILRKDFDGLQVRGNAAVSEPGYGPNQFVSAMAGKNFNEGRGNITLQAEYAHQERVYASDIPWLRRVDGFATVDADSPGLPQGSDGFPDAVFFRDLRSTTTNRYGLAVVPQPQVGGLCGAGTLANNGPANTNGAAFNCNYVFDPNGGLAAQTGTRFGTGPAGSIVGGNGQTGREGTQLAILPYNQRINTNILAHYTFSDALELFFEGKYVRVNAIGNQLGPTFLNNSTSSLGVDARIDPRLDNPYLSQAARNTISTAYLANNCGYTLGTAVSTAQCQTLNAAQLAARNAAIANGSYRFLFARNLTDLPDRDEYFTRKTYRFVGGARGNFFNDWNYEVSVNYGKQEETADLRGFVDRQRFLLSLDAGRNPVTGQIQCRSQFDAASANGITGNTAAAAKLAGDIAACVPYNLFGQGNNQAASNYFKANILNRDSIEQFDVNGFVGGNTSKLFSLPGGPISFVIGGEYRREKVFNDSDGAADTGLTNAVFLGDVDPAALKVTEGFAEIRAPLLKDLPLLKALTAIGAARVSHYNNATGTVWAYNYGGEWTPFDGLRFRGVYGRAVRAPNVTEYGFPSVPNFANGFIDPCNVNAIANGTAARATNCQTQLTAAQLANLPVGGYSLGIISGSNPNLTAETSDSWTYGGVFTPRFIPGLSLSVDYYNIRVNNVIVSLAAQTIVNACYDSPNLSSPLCNTFRRNLTNAAGANGELPGAILTNSLVSGPQNFAKRIRKGIDVELAYRHSFTPDVSIDSRVIYSHGIQNSNFENPSIPDTQNYILRELGDPKDEYRWDANVTFRAFTLGYQLHYIGPMLTSTFENFFPNNAGVTGQTGLPLNSDAFDIYSYPGVFYHDIRLNARIRGGADARRDFTFYVGIDNLTDVRPPFGSTGTGAGSSIYSIRGRNYFAGVKAKF